MKVNVFIAQDDGKTPRELLVLPYGPLGGIPEHLQHLEWRNLATTLTDDKLLSRYGTKIDADIRQQGYSLVPQAD